MDAATHDADLARLAAAGDRDAHAALCRRLAPRLHAIARRRGLDRGDARAHVARALVGVVGALRAGGDPDRLPAVMIAALDGGAPAGASAAMTDPLDEIEPVIAAGAADDAAPVVEPARLAACLDRLAEDERAAVATLATGGGVDVVKRHRALRRLRALLDEEPAT